MGSNPGLIMGQLITLRLVTPGEFLGRYRDWCLTYPFHPVHTSKEDSVEEVIGGVTWKVRMTSLRYYLFERSLECVTCGLSGDHFRLETHRGSDILRTHYNLYAVLPDAKIMLFTKDHILPRSKGGKNDLSNLQTMCHECNVAKGNKC